MRKKFAVDYDRMSAMIFAKPHGFEAVMKSIEALEERYQRGQIVDQQSAKKFDATIVVLEVAG